jgi:hypothetical protein
MLFEFECDTAGWEQARVGSGLFQQAQFAGTVWAIAEMVGNRYITIWVDHALLKGKQILAGRAEHTIESLLKGLLEHSKIICPFGAGWAGLEMIAHTGINGIIQCGDQIKIIEWWWHCAFAVVLMIRRHFISPWVLAPHHAVPCS